MVKTEFRNELIQVQQKPNIPSKTLFQIWIINSKFALLMLEGEIVNIVPLQISTQVSSFTNSYNTAISELKPCVWKCATAISIYKIFKSDNFLDNLKHWHELMCSLIKVHKLLKVVIVKWSHVLKSCNGPIVDILLIKFLSLFMNV